MPSRVPGDPVSMRRRWRRASVIAGVVLLVAIVSATALHHHGDAHPSTRLTVGWGGSEGHPCCVYQPKGGTVEAKLTIEGTAPHDNTTVTMTVTAYADENTSIPAGTASRTVRVSGSVHKPVMVIVPVGKAPHVDDDGVTACRLSVRYGRSKT